MTAAQRATLCKAIDGHACAVSNRFSIAATELQNAAHNANASVYELQYYGQRRQEIFDADMNELAACIGKVQVLLEAITATYSNATRQEVTESAAQHTYNELIEAIEESEKLKR